MIKKNFLFWFWMYTLLVILWGAWVRISHSGAGCGDHWPSCGGELIPTGGNVKTWTEYFHRLMSGVYGLLVIFIFFNLRRIKNSPILKNLNLSLFILMVSEALLGALLVKGQLVTENDSFYRLLVMSFHQLNSFLLTGVTFLIYLHFKNDTPIYFYHRRIFILFLVLPVTGAIASLSTTLFPSVSLWQGIVADFTEHSHLFIRLRVLHPILALLIAGGFFMWLLQKNHTRLALEFLFAIAVGLITLMTLSPVYLKLAHLLIAHLLWARCLQLFVSLPDSSKR